VHSKNWKPLIVSTHSWKRKEFFVSKLLVISRTQLKTLVVIVSTQLKEVFIFISTKSPVLMAIFSALNRQWELQLAGNSPMAVATPLLWKSAPYNTEKQPPTPETSLHPHSMELASLTGSSQASVHVAIWTGDFVSACTYRHWCWRFAQGHQTRHWFWRFGSCMHGFHVQKCPLLEIT